MDTVLNCLVTDSVGPGEYLDRFQKQAKESLAYDFGFALRSPVTALQVGFDALGLVAGDVVAVPALAPAYYDRALRERGLTPFFLDADPASGSPEFESLRSAEPKPKALILFEGLGIMPPDPASIHELGLQVIEDISQSLGAYSGETRAGAIGHISMLGLEHGALVTAGGGALLFSHGRREGNVLRNVAESILPELRMTDYNAALGLAQFRELEASIAKRRELSSLFAQSLARTRHKLLSPTGEGEAGYYSFPVVLESGMKDVRAYAKKKEVETEPAFEKSLVGAGLVPEGVCPKARSLVMRCLLFPLHQRIGAAGAQKVSKVLATLP